MSCYLVTGVAGFVGRWIAERLLREGHAVRGIDNFSTGKRQNLVGLERLDFIEGDMPQTDTIERVCDGVEAVFHEAV